MANRMLRRETQGGHHYGVLETPCFPASFYAGMIQGDSWKGYFPCDNSTSRFHRTVVEANSALEAEMARHAKGEF